MPAFLKVWAKMFLFKFAVLQLGFFYLFWVCTFPITPGWFKLRFRKIFSKNSGGEEKATGLWYMTGYISGKSRYWIASSVFAIAIAIAFMAILSMKLIAPPPPKKKERDSAEGMVLKGLQLQRRKKNTCLYQAFYNWTVCSGKKK